MNTSKSKYHCDTCNVDICIFNTDRHNKSKSHIKKLGSTSASKIVDQFIDYKGAIINSFNEADLNGEIFDMYVEYTKLKKLMYKEELKEFIDNHLCRACDNKQQRFEQMFQLETV